MPLLDGGSRITNYIVEKRESTRKAYSTVTTNCQKCSLRIPNLAEGCEYYFRVLAENEFGIGEPAETAEPVRASEAPSPPESLNIMDTTRNSVSLAWPKPEHDAENMAGKSKPSKPSEPMFALDPIDPPGKPIPLNITRHAVTLKWTKPEYNGGFKITGYTVEKRDLPNGRWLKANFSNILETEFTVSGLTEDAAYEFRVIARNAAGAVSQPSEPSDAITCRDDIEAPKIMVDARYKDTIVLKAGEVFRLEADVSGRPPPTLTWTKDGKELEDTAKLEIKIVDFSTVLINKDSVRKDGGAYILTASNPGGFAKHIFQVKVLDRPGPPEGPLAVTEVTEEKCVLSWLPPLDDGGAKIDHYVVEKRSEKWSTCATVKVTEATITGMIQGEEYSFRVSAQNEKGISDPRQLGIPVVAKDLVIAPAFKLLFTTFSVLAGEDLKVDVPFVGRPTPAVSWFKDDIPLSMDPKYKETIIVNADESFKIDADVYGKPLPSIQWFKGDHELANTARLEIKSTDFA
uniref:Titin n=1 Tax=Crocodylus porosus TaxID=8502 RepID=A0A7M4F6N7_CROPO